MSAALTGTQAGVVDAAHHVEYLLRLADSPLILGQRLAEWCGHGPILEEDIALSNVALDLIGQARLLLGHAGRVEGAGRDEDALAFLRDTREFRNCTLVELPNDYAVDGGTGGGGTREHGAGEPDYAIAIVRNFLFSSCQSLLWQRLGSSADDELSAIAMKSLKEARYHEEHAAEWLVCLGDGTDESHRRTQRALSALWPYVPELFAADDVDRTVAAAGIGVDPSTLEEEWRAGAAATIERATLVLPPDAGMQSRGRFGLHSEHLGYLLAEMQFLQRAYPGGSW